MDMIHAAYLAGIVDGEGTITIHRHQFYKRGTYQLRPRLIVSNTNLRLLNHLRDVHGGTIISNRAATARRSESFLWRIFSIDEIYRIVLAIRPFLLVKDRQADVMLAFLRSRKGAQRSASWYEPYTEVDWDCFRQIETLNRRAIRAEQGAVA